MKKLLLFCLLLVGCDIQPKNNIEKQIMSSQYLSNEWTDVCIDGVKYLHRANGYAEVLSPHLNTDGKPKLCENQN